MSTPDTGSYSMSHTTTFWLSEWTLRSTKRQRKRYKMTHCIVEKSKLCKSSFMWENSHEFLWPGRIRDAQTFCLRLLSEQSQAWIFFASHARVRPNACVQRSIALPACDRFDWIAYFGPCETPQTTTKLWTAAPTYLFPELGFLQFIL